MTVAASICGCDPPSRAGRDQCLALIKKFPQPPVCPSGILKPVFNRPPNVLDLLVDGGDPPAEIRPGAGGGFPLGPQLIVNPPGEGFQVGADPRYFSETIEHFGFDSMDDRRARAAWGRTGRGRSPCRVGTADSRTRRRCCYPSGTRSCSFRSFRIETAHHSPSMASYDCAGAHRSRIAASPWLPPSGLVRSWRLPPL